MSTLHSWPLKLNKMNRLEVASLAVNSIFIYFGLIFISGQHYKLFNYDNPSMVVYVFTILILVPTLGYNLYWPYFLKIEILKSIYKFNQYMFRVITLARLEPKEFAEEHIMNEQTVVSADISHVFTRENEVQEEELIPGLAIRKGNTKGIDQLKIEKYEESEQLKSLQEDMK